MRVSRTMSILSWFQIVDGVGTKLKIAFMTGKARYRWAMPRESL